MGFSSVSFSRPASISGIKTPEGHFFDSLETYAGYFDACAGHGQERPTAPVWLEEVYLHVPSGILVNRNGCLLSISCPEPYNIGRSRLLGKAHPGSKVRTRHAVGSSIMHRQALKNYYHWFIDCLPRLFYYREALAGIKVMLPPRKGIFLDMLQWLCPPEVEVAFSQEKWQYFAHFLWLPPVSADGAGKIPVGFQDYLRRCLALPEASAVSPQARWGYISRAQANRRRLLHEAVFVERCILPFGGEVVCFEQMDFHAQMQKASEMDFLVGLHGAGLTNLIAMAPPASVLEIRSFSRTMDHYKVLAHASGVRHFTYWVESRQAVNEDVILTQNDLDGLQQAIRAHLKPGR